MKFVKRPTRIGVLCVLLTGSLIASCERQNADTEEELTHDGAEDNSIDILTENVSFIPGDLYTSLGEEPLLALRIGNAPAPEELINELQSSIVLRNLQTSEDVPIEFDVNNPGFMEEDACPGTSKDATDCGTFSSPPTEPVMIRILPQVPLNQDDWHALGLVGLDPDTEASLSFPAPYNEILGGYSVRFVPGVSPTFRAVELCDRREEEGVHRLYVNLSEHVTGSPELIAITQKDNPEMECEILPEWTRPEPGNFGTAAFNCTSGNPDATWDITVNPGLVSSVDANIPLRNFKGQSSFTMTISPEEYVAGRCAPYWENK